MIWANVEYCLGSDFQGARDRLLEMTEVLHQRSSTRFGLVEVLNQLVLIADGKIGASTVLQFSDMIHRESSLARPLALQRSYSSVLSVRRRQGPMGRGWVVPVLEMRINLKRTGDVLLEMGRVVYLFQAKDDGLYRSDSLQADYITEETDAYHYVTEDDIYYSFSKDNGRLIAFGTEELIQIHYTDRKPTVLKDSEGNKMRLQYNSQNLVSSVSIDSSTGLVLDEIFYTYDSDNFLRSVRKGSEITSYGYTPQGDLSEVHYSSGSRHEVTYDERSWLSGLAFYQQGEMLSGSDLKLDCSGRLTIVTQPENATAELSFGYGGVVAKLQSASNAPISLRSNPRTNTQEVYVGDEVVNTQSFDSETQTFTETDANGDTLVIKLNDNGDVLEASTSLGTLYTNNVTDGLLRSIKHPDGTADIFDYNDSGRINKHTLRDGSDVFYEFDDRDNLVRKTLNTGTVFYVYDSKSRLAEVHSENGGNVKIEYNDRGLPSKVLYEDGVELLYYYNDNNLRTSLSTNSGYQVYYKYDSHNRLTSILDGKNVTLVTFYYDKKGRLVRRTTGNGASTAYGFEDTSLRLRNVNNSLEDGSVLSSFTYKYDTKGYRSSILTTDGTWNFKYDALGQMIEWESPFGDGETLSYDSNRNRVTKTTKGRATDSYTYKNLNQMLKFGKSDSFKNDLNGNLAEKTSRGGGKEAFTFNQEGRITLTETTKRRCEYGYSGIGVLTKKSCSDGTVVTYVVDPFSAYGSDILSQTVGDETSFMYYAMEQGLVAQKDKISSDFEYFLFDGDGSVIHTVTDSGTVEGNFIYDPFGKQIRGSRNGKRFAYLGQLGVSELEESANMLLFRARIYDAEHGRFISPDPLGPLDQPRNLYIYAKNNPLAFKDPSGEFAHIVAGTIIGGVIGAGANAGLQVFDIWREGRSWSDFSVKDVAGAALGGAITGAAVSSGAALGGLAGAGVTAAGGFVGGFAERGTADALKGNFNLGRSITSGLINAPAALVPWKMLGYKGKYATGFGKVSTKLKTALGFNPKYRATAKTLWKSLGVGTAVGNAASRLGDAVRKWWDGNKDDIGDWWDDTTDHIRDLWDDTTDGIGEFWDDLTDIISRWGKYLGDWFQNWIRSIDPNDIIGPVGYGDSNFIAPGIDMDYMIRFENDENATAPAQRVTVSCPLDEDLDPTTFRLGSFGFGDFEIELDYTTPIYQQMIDVSNDGTMFVYFQAGVDVLNKEGFWLFQTIDPVTGLPPTDPSIGFLPPNNKTSGSGEGFMKFRIQQRSDLLHGTVIDEQASIVFDENAPIETPPIFHTIDDTWPTVNVTVNQELTAANGIVVSLAVDDTGSGFKEADIFTVSTAGDLTSLLTKVNQSTVSLPLDAGTSHRVIVVPTDHVGNVKPLDTTDYTEVSYVVSCPGDCAGNGQCQPSGQCQCHTGFHGEGCTSNSTILEPPILDFTFQPALEDRVTTLYVRARSSSISVSDILTVTLNGFPSGSTFDKGTVNDGSLRIDEDEFGDVQMTAPHDLSGVFVVTVSAVLLQNGQSATREEKYTLSLTPVADPPMLEVVMRCEQKSIKLEIQASSTDVDGSENIVVHIAGLPDFITIYGYPQSGGSVDVAPGEYVLTADQAFDTFLLNVTAIASESEGLDVSIVSQTVEVVQCGRSPTTIQPGNTTKKKSSSADHNARLSIMGLIMVAVLYSMIW